MSFSYKYQMLVTEILLYDYITDWNLSQLLESNTFLQHSQPNFPLVVAATTGLTAPNKIAREFYVDNKRRGKPSELRATSRDSLVSYAAEKLKLQGHVSTIAAECSGSSYALYTGTMLSYIHQTPVFVFCADNMLDDDLQMWRFASFGAMHQDSGRSFDSSSKGFRMGVGAGLFLIKHPSVKHTLPTFATISNYNFYTNPSLITNPGSGEDLINHIHGIDFSTIDLWNAHATGTPVGDKFEYDVFNTLIKKDIPIIGYKGYVGHCTAASGAVEICMSFDDYKNNQLRPNIILGEPIVNDPRILTKSTSFSYRRILKANFGFGGKNVICQIDIQ